jgi:multiple sugar transport system permease protein
VLVAFAAFPFDWILITTFKTDGDLYDLWFNAAPTLEHIRYLFGETLFVRWPANRASASS